jgi:hypothetical protein
MTNSASLGIHLEQGTIPVIGKSWSTTQAAHVRTIDLAPGNWPWVPAESYFLLVTNLSAQVQSFDLQMQGTAPAILANPVVLKTPARTASGALSLEAEVPAGLTVQLQRSFDLRSWTTVETRLSSAGTVRFEPPQNLEKETYYRMAVILP